ncbi:MAG: penicillin acylase family protein, partial [Bacteroidota bacterium]|nr:penicillin acylase family protein [Bacteroidota bacterium]
DNYNIFAQMAVPVLVSHMEVGNLSKDESAYLDTLKSWNYRNDPHSKATTLFVLTWDSLEHVVWDDEFEATHLKLMMPYESTLLNDVLKDTTFKFLDNINTPQKETLADDVTKAFKEAVGVAEKAELKGKLSWAKFKDTKVLHLARLDAFSRLHLPIGGGTHTINAANAQHGPSWRMIVSLTPETQAYGVYPGGQSGNPGSQYYDNFVDAWAKGKYYTLWVMNASEANNPKVKWTMTFDKGSGSK